MRKISSLFVLFYFFLATVYITFPIIFHLNNRIMDLGDAQFISWVLNWDIHSFVTNIFNIYQGNIFYPYHNTVAYSDTFFTSALLVAIPILITKEPMVAFNLHLILSFTLLGFCTYLFVRYLTQNEFTAIIGGTLMAFSTFIVSKTVHSQLISIEWVPLSLLFFFKYLEKRKLRDFIVCLVFFYLQVANSFLPGYFLLFCFTTIIVYFVIVNRQRVLVQLTKIEQWKLWMRKYRGELFALVFLGFLLLPLVIPYFQVSREFNYHRDIRDAIHFANRPEYTFWPSERTRLQRPLLNLFYKNDKGPFKYDGYFGLALISLGIFSLVFRFKRFINPQQTIFILIAVGSFIMSLGPVWQWGGHVIKKPFMIPLPYAVAYYLVPGFQGMRNSARWEVLTVFALAVLVGITLGYLLKGKSKLLQIFLTILICGVVLWEYHPVKQYPVASRHDFPPVYQYIADHIPQKAGIAILPLYNWDMLPYSWREDYRVYYSTLSFPKIMNGTSGFTPPQRELEAKKLILTFPNDEAMKILKKNNIKYVVFEKDEYKLLEENKLQVLGKSIPSLASIEAQLKKQKQLQMIKRVGNTSVYLFNPF